MTSTSFWDHFPRVFQLHPTPHALWAAFSTWCPVSPHADWCLQSDVMPNLGLQDYELEADRSTTLAVEVRQVSALFSLCWPL